jgi:hypothetical protein
VNNCPPTPGTVSAAAVRALPSGREHPPVKNAAAPVRQAAARATDNQDSNFFMPPQMREMSS